LIVHVQEAPTPTALPKMRDVHDRDIEASEQTFESLRCGHAETRKVEE